MVLGKTENVLIHYSRVTRFGNSKTPNRQCRRSHNTLDYIVRNEPLRGTPRGKEMSSTYNTVYNV